MEQALSVGRVVGAAVVTGRVGAGGGVREFDDLEVAPSEVGAAVLAIPGDAVVGVGRSDGVGGDDQHFGLPGSCPCLAYIQSLARVALEAATPRPKNLEKKKPSP